jgi:hypothetical protein
MAEGGETDPGSLARRLNLTMPREAMPSVGELIHAGSLPPRAGPLELRFRDNAPKAPFVERATGDFLAWRC